MNTTPRLDETQPLAEHAIPERAGVTFAEMAGVSHIPSSDLIIRTLNDELEIGPGDKAFFLKTYMDHVAPDESDKAFMRDPQAMSVYHDEVASFIAGNLKIWAPQADAASRDVLSTVRQQYVDSLEQGKTTFGNYIAAYASWAGNKQEPQPTFPTRAARYMGLGVRTADGKTIDLLSDAPVDIRPTIYLQQEVVGLFMHYTSMPYRNEAARGHMDQMTKRIYLNPRIRDSVAIFQEIVTLCEGNGIRMKGKILDRSLESLSVLVSPEKHRSIRGDSIVLYAGEQADKLLAIAEDVYKRHYEAFKDRSIAKIPVRVADGVAVGEEPGIRGESLTSHRVDFLLDVQHKTKEAMGLKSYEKIPPARRLEAVRIYRQTFESLAPQRNISAHNLAFNAHD